MPGENGIEIAKRMRKQNQRTVLIFVTALKEYVFEAFDVGAFHYLVKPFDDEKFREVLLRAVEQYRQINVLVQQRKAEERFLTKSNISAIASLKAPFSICLPTETNNASIRLFIDGLSIPAGIIPSKYFEINANERFTKFPYAPSSSPLWL